MKTVKNIDLITEQRKTIKCSMFTLAIIEA